MITIRQCPQDINHDVASSRFVLISAALHDLSEIDSEAYSNCSLTLTTTVFDNPILSGSDSLVVASATSFSAVIKKGSAIPTPLLGLISESFNAFLVGMQKNLALFDQTTIVMDSFRAVVSVSYIEAINSSMIQLPLSPLETFSGVILGSAEAVINSPSYDEIGYALSQYTVSPYSGVNGISSTNLKLIITEENLDFSKETLDFVIINTEPLEEDNNNAKVGNVHCQLAAEPYSAEVNCSAGMNLTVTCPGNINGTIRYSCPHRYRVPVCLRSNGEAFEEDPSCSVVSYSRYNTTCRCKISSSSAANAAIQPEARSGTTIEREVGASTQIVSSKFVANWESAGSLDTQTLTGNPIIFSVCTSIILGTLIVLAILIADDRLSSTMVALASNTEQNSVKVLLDYVLPIEFSDLPWYTKLWRNVLNTHPLFAIIAPDRNRVRRRAKSWLILSVKILNVLFLNSIVSVLVVNASVCNQYSDKLSCEKPLRLDLINRLCSWNDSGKGTCTNQPINSDFAVMIRTVLILLLLFPLNSITKVLVSIVDKVCFFKDVLFGTDVWRYDSFSFKKAKITSSNAADNNKLNEIEQNSFCEGKEDSMTNLKEPLKIAKQCGVQDLRENNFMISHTVEDGLQSNSNINEQLNMECDGDKNVTVISCNDYRVATHPSNTLTDLDISTQEQELSASIYTDEKLISMNDMLVINLLDKKISASLRIGAATIFSADATRRKTQLLNMLDAARKAATKEATSIKRLTTQQQKSSYILFLFSSGIMSGQARKMALRRLFLDVDSIDKNYATWIKFSCVALLFVYLFGACAYIFLFANTLDGQMEISWLKTFLLVSFQAIFVIEPLYLTTKYLALTYILRDDMELIVDVVKRAVKRMKADSEDTISQNDNLLLRHVNVGYRLAIMFPELPIARLIQSIPDCDLEATLYGMRRMKYLVCELAFSICSCFIFLIRALPFDAEEIIFSIITVLGINGSFVEAASKFKTGAIIWIFAFILLCIAIVIHIALYCFHLQSPHTYFRPCAQRAAGRQASSSVKRRSSVFPDSCSLISEINDAVRPADSPNAREDDILHEIKDDDADCSDCSKLEIRSVESDMDNSCKSDEWIREASHTLNI